MYELDSTFYYVAYPDKSFVHCSTSQNETRILIWSMNASKNVSVLYQKLYQCSI